MRAMFWRKKTIEEKAKQLALAMVELARTIAPRVWEQLYFREAKPQPERQSDQTTSLALELIYFSLHLLDRECFARHGEGERNKFMDTLMIEIWKPFLDALPEKSEFTTGQAIIEQANQAQLEYAQYAQLHPEEDQPLGGTLFWEFSKRLVRNYKPSNTMAVFALNAVVSAYVQTLYELVNAVKL
jgi:hypothetical protein